MSSLPRCFDPTAAERLDRVVRLPRARIVDLLPITHAPERIAQYRRSMVAGDRFPPVAVLRLGGRAVLADGHKRFAASEGLLETLPVECWTLERFLRDQARQARFHARRNLRVVLGLGVLTRESRAAVAATARHWWRVACSLSHLALRPRNRRRRRALQPPRPHH